MADLIERLELYARDMFRGNDERVRMDIKEAAKKLRAYRDDEPSSLRWQRCPGCEQRVGWIVDDFDYQYDRDGIKWHRRCLAERNIGERRLRMYRRARRWKRIWRLVRWLIVS